ncbi:dynein axonemal heavy chain 7-like [Leptopilina heterotoma]|uniref:dynein axonemal heavy chain 7-like n=1 Tax=Leptopilina heterotoma TaxID=63436 RepID=UPI001CA9800D|nr:dynein axonemal heavy chain 7-like [Leptopilina heterotoma]XP_043468823.1 dynein axonemal heavy chain 7-like [Leptopilina heterotoma]
MNLDQLVEKFEGISESASKESTLEKNIHRMHKDLSDMVFTVNPYKNIGTYVVAGVDDIQVLLYDHITKAITIKIRLILNPLRPKLCCGRRNYSSSRDSSFSPMMNYWKFSPKLKIQLVYSRI